MSGGIVINGGAVSITIHGGAAVAATQSPVYGRRQRRARPAGQRWISDMINKSRSLGLAVLAILGAAGPALAKPLPAVPVEDPRKVDAVITPMMLNAGAALVRAQGWTCDSISAARVMHTSVGYTLRCNNWRYAYDIADKGGILSGRQAGPTSYASSA